MRRNDLIFMGGTAVRGKGGRISLGVLIFLAILALAIYLGFRLVPPYWEFYSLKEAARQGVVGASAPPYHDSDARDAVMEKARRLGVPLQEEDLSIVRDGNAISIEFSWKRDITLPGYIHHLTFAVKDSEPLH
jgi:hypothetical protein